MFDGKKFESLAKVIGGHDMLVYLYGCAIGMAALKAGQFTSKFFQARINRRRRSELMFELGTLLEGKRQAKVEVLNILEDVEED